MADKFHVTRIGQSVEARGRFWVLRVDEHGTPLETAAARLAVKVYAGLVAHIEPENADAARQLLSEVGEK